MPGAVLHQGAVVTCAHGGSARALAPIPRVLVNGQAVVVVLTPYGVAGCSLSGSGTPPCASAQWMSGSTRVTVNGAFVAVQLGQSTCVPTGTPMLPVAVQPRVVAT